MTWPALVTAQNSGRSARTVAVAVQSRSGAVRRCSIQRASAAAGRRRARSGLAQTATSWPWPCWSVFERRTRRRRPRPGTVSTSPRVSATSSERRSAAPKPSSSIARSRAPSGVSGAGRAASIRRSTPGTAGAAWRRGRTPFDRVTPSTTMARRGWRRSSERPASRWAVRIAARCTRIELTARRGPRALIGAADDVHGDGVGIGGERFAAEAAAPGLVLAPGRAVGAAGAVAAGAGGVDRGAAGELLELGGAGGAVGHGERAEQGGLQGQGPRPGQRSWDGPDGRGWRTGGWWRGGRGGQGAWRRAGCRWSPAALAADRRPGRA